MSSNQTSKKKETELYRIKLAILTLASAIESGTWVGVHSHVLDILHPSFTSSKVPKSKRVKKQ